MERRRATNRSRQKKMSNSVERKLRGFGSGGGLLTGDTGRVVVGSHASAGRVGDVHESSDVLHSLLRASSRLLGDVLVLRNLRGLVLHLSGTSQRSVHLSCVIIAKRTDRS